MSDQQVTQLLDAARAGDSNANDQLLPAMYDQLRKLAGYQMRNENAGHTLQATALVNEAYLKMAGKDALAENRMHYIALYARAMRRILVDHARGKNTEKRGGDYAQVTLSGCEAEMSVSDSELSDLDAVLTELAGFDERAAKAIELMYFGGLTYEEVAEYLQVGRSTVYQDVKAAKAWMAVRMSETDA